jgi:flagellar biosynthesis protein FlhG
MNDQAEHLRMKLSQHAAGTNTKTIAVVSGKGGVGKSNISLNFAISLKKKGHSVLLLDMDIGMGNIEILMGLSSTFSIADFFTVEAPLKDMITEIPGGIHYISGGTGLSQLTKITRESFQRFFEQFSNLLTLYEFVILDMDAGMSEQSLNFILTVDEVIIVTTPEPPSITDAYAAMKHITLKNKAIPFYMIVNRTKSEYEGFETFNRISKVMNRFLEKNVLLLGVLPDDPIVRQAVIEQTPFIQLNDKTPVSKELYRIVDKYCQRQFNTNTQFNKITFIAKLRRFLFER